MHHAYNYCPLLVQLVKSDASMEQKGCPTHGQRHCASPRVSLSETYKTDIQTDTAYIVPSHHLRLPHASPQNCLVLALTRPHTDIKKKPHSLHNHGHANISIWTQASGMAGNPE